MILLLLISLSAVLPFLKQLICLKLISECDVVAYGFSLALVFFVGPLLSLGGFDYIAERLAFDRTEQISGALVAVSFLSIFSGSILLVALLGIELAVWLWLSLYAIYLGLLKFLRSSEGAGNFFLFTCVKLVLDSLFLCVLLVRGWELSFDLFIRIECFSLFIVILLIGNRLKWLSTLLSFHIFNSRILKVSGAYFFSVAASSSVVHLDKVSLQNFMSENDFRLLVLCGPLAALFYGGLAMLNSLFYRANIQCVKSGDLSGAHQRCLVLVVFFIVCWPLFNYTCPALYSFIDKEEIPSIVLKYLYLGGVVLVVNVYGGVVFLSEYRIWIGVMAILGSSCLVVYGVCFGVTLVGVLLLLLVWRVVSLFVMFALSNRITGYE